MRTLRPALALMLLGVAGLVRAQEPDGVRRVVLPSQDAQVRARLLSLDGRLNPVHAPELAASVIGLTYGQGLAAFAPMLTDPRNLEVWEQLPEEYYRLAQESGDALVALPGRGIPGQAGWTSVQVRRLCHQRFTQLPRTALRWYRNRLDAEANALFEEGRQSRSVAPLRRLVDELFCSSVGDQALDLLGDLAFERGDFEEACHWWRQLAPLESPGPERLVFPDRKVDLPRVEAKQILARIFQGRWADAQAAMVRYRQRHPRASGDLAAENGLYSEILDRTLKAFRPRRPSGEEPWPTFGGANTRNTPPLELTSQLWEDGTAWRVPLPLLAAARQRDPDRRAAFHPIIVNQQVLIADHRSVNSYHLHTGRELFRFDLKGAGLSDPGLGVSPRRQRPRFTLSAGRDRAYVRLGGVGTLREPSYVVCLDLTQPETKKRRLLWHVAPPGNENGNARFEGTPLVHDGRVYVAVSKSAGERVVTSIVCYDVKGRQRWSREVCDCPDFAATRGQQQLLTWTGGQLVYCSDAGAIVAVDAWSGQPTWAVRYESRGPSAAPDLTPCVFADGLVYAAPRDADGLFCIEADTGQVRWTLDGIEVTHLLGVAHGKLVFGTRDGIHAVEASSGAEAWTQPGAGRLPGLGRGLIAGDWVLWPTRDVDLPCRALALDTGEPSIDPSRLYALPVGNAAFGQGCLAIAGLDELVVFVPANLSRPPLLGPRPQARLDGDFRIRRDLRRIIR